MATPTSAPTLRRVLGFRTVLSTSAGLSYAAISFLGCVLVASYVAGDGAWLAILIAGGLALLASLCFSELNSLYPTAAAIRQYINAAFNERLSLIVALSYTATIVAVIGADSYVVGTALEHALGLQPSVTLVIILIILAMAMLANLRGIRIAGVLQDVTTYALLVSAIAISVIGLASHGFALHTPLAGLDNGGNLFNAVAAGVFVFSAFEWVTPLAEEISNQKLIPRGMFVAVGVLFVAYGLFTLAMTNLLSVQDASGVWHLPTAIVGSATQPASPFPQMLMAEAALGDVGKWWMLVATLFTGVMTFNGGFATASRFLYAAAREGTLPEAFTRINQAIVPWVTVVVLTVASAAVAVVIFITQQFQVLILVGAALEAMIYTVAGLCVIQLRRRHPQVERSFLIPLGWTVPILVVAIFGLLFFGAVFQTTPDTSPLAVPGIIIVLFALSTIYVFTVVPRLKAKLAAQQTTRRRRPSASPPPTIEQ